MLMRQRIACQVNATRFAAMIDVVKCVSVKQQGNMSGVGAETLHHGLCLR